jgi:UDP-N-acetylglucosamine 2-epimerase (non-hydrolysing)
MDRIFFEQLELPEAKYNLEVGSGSHAEQTGKMLIGIEKVLREEKPSVVLVEGDTNTVLAGALAAYKLGIKVGHVEAGLRSYDRRMPEEINRVLADHCSDFLFAPTEKSKQILLHEGIAEEKIFVTGNTVVDAVFQNLEISKYRMNLLAVMGLTSGAYFVATVHRQENVDDEKRFRGIVKGLEKVRKNFGFKLIYPVHPRARERLKEFGLEPRGVRLVEPLDYLGFLQLEGNARLVLTDSGGVQEETCILRVPCVTLRDNTERPETLDVESNVLAGTKPDKIAGCVKLMLDKKNDWQNPFGDGQAGKRIIEILRRELD